jgi:flagellar biosynthesis/type III secretory pathway protein FliH
MKMYKEWMAAVLEEEREKAYSDGYDAGWDEGRESMEAV